MKTIKRFFLLAFCALFFVNVHTVAQVTIGGETEPVKGATLDLSPENGYVGGLKLPNVNLTSLTEIPMSFTDNGNITTANLKGLQVYNTNATIGEGVYTWNGSRWTMTANKWDISKKITWDDLNISEAEVNNRQTIGSINLEKGTYLVIVNTAMYFTSKDPDNKGLVVDIMRDNSIIQRFGQNLQTYGYLRVRGASIILLDGDATISVQVGVSAAGKFVGSTEAVINNTSPIYFIKI